jgi:hypothetical protein
MTPERFKIEMQRIIEEYADDPEVCHSECDALMMKLLDELGYDEGVELFNCSKRWYA